MDWFIFPAAWSGDDDKDQEKGGSSAGENEKKTFNSSSEIIVDYSEYSTIQVQSNLGLAAHSISVNYNISHYN